VLQHRVRPFSSWDRKRQKEPRPQGRGSVEPVNWIKI
jgi:hypothetical protein